MKGFVAAAQRNLVFTTVIKPGCFQPVRVVGNTTTPQLQQKKVLQSDFAKHIEILEISVQVPHAEGHPLLWYQDLGYYHCSSETHL